MNIQNELKQILTEFQTQITLKPNQVMVVGCSTSEVVGEKIGCGGKEEIAEIIFNELQTFSKLTGIALAFQCCEHLNRTLVIERELHEKGNFEEVSVIPIPKAGGQMAAYAYLHFKDPCVIEHIKADYGIDIGDTFIGMHLKHVAVPVRVSLNSIGFAHVTLAKSRPKLIGGERAVYRL